MSPVWATLIAGIGGSIIGLGGAFLLSKRNHFNGAADEFSIPFLKTLILLNAEYTITEIPAIDTRDILSKAFLSHISAYYKFRRFVCEINREAFSKAWDGLYPPGENTEEKYGFLNDYLEIGSVDIEANRRRQLAIKRINILLEFAKP